MGVAGGVGWLEALTTPNADVERVRAVINARGLHVPTLLDELATQWRQGNEKTRRVLLLAHAGDGKTEFIGRATAGLDVRVFDDHPGVPRWAEAGRWVMNDPSQLPTERVVAFLNAAFGDDGEGIFLAGINRGLLRAMVAHESLAPTPKAWLSSCLGESYGVHDVGEGRLCVPLDRRVLVPARTTAAAADSASGVLARRVFSALADDLGVVGWDADVWARDVARVLALVEACGHHVTFREVLGLAAAVALSLRSEPSVAQPASALAALFGAAESASAGVPSLTALLGVLGRLDPARGAHPSLDVLYHQGAVRDRAVRAQWLDGLAGERHPTAMFLRLCEGRKGEGEGSRIVRRGLSRLAGKHDARDAEVDLLPVTTSVHPGTVRRGALAQRGMLDLRQAVIEPTRQELGPYVVPGMRCPVLTVVVPEGEVAPRLELDLELFQMLWRAGEEPGVERAALGPRVAQVDGWFDATAAAWAGALRIDPPKGLVTVQTFLGGDSIALRPSAPGTAAAWVQAAPADPSGSALTVLTQMFDEKVLLTPSACASALLRWAGIVPLPSQAREEAKPTERDASGAPRIAKVGQFSKGMKSPLFPWSAHTLDLAFEDAALDAKGVWARLSPTLGATLARSLGWATQADEWRAALRAAWRDDEEDFDQHPSGKLVHQWLGCGVGDRQLSGIQGDRVAERPKPLRARVAHDLLAEKVPFPRTHRWWLLGTWASWALLRDALERAHNRPDPVLLCLVSADAGGGKGAGVEEYRRVHEGWWMGRDDRKPIAWAAKAAGFLQPANLLTRVDLPLEGPLLDVLQVIARTVDVDGERRPERRTVRALEEALLEAGLYLQPPGGEVRLRVPDGALTREAPTSPAFGALLRATLQRLGMLDAASDGATLFRPPWREESGR